MSTDDLANEMLLCVRTLAKDLDLKESMLLLATMVAQKLGEQNQKLEQIRGAIVASQSR